jgi:hypothetical protein
LDFVGKDFDVEVKSVKYDEYVKREADKKERERRRVKARVGLNGSAGVIIRGKM